MRRKLLTAGNLAWTRKTSSRAGGSSRPTCRPCSRSCSCSEQSLLLFYPVPFGASVLVFPGPKYTSINNVSAPYSQWVSDVSQWLSHHSSTVFLCFRFQGILLKFTACSYICSPAGVRFPSAFQTPSQHQRLTGHSC